ncbi:cupin domain-containing protein [Pseudomonas vancouverensis]|uniref:Cupin domain-containing protein n=1 Tax=Pseudomonas vancouverensis TaxID=95300 RepID=A0A1H2PBX9_PSEVA|nr:cupin domain-containing protein [Pseudomonas vancouverensis]KAB0493776.1 cupin domain-containing protein [Pseudomonas vancouverensis]TDB67647.1 cupin domain-containing protein [Pseudomonas vancouverensis]SDV15182.1 Cupin domain-containing protein [Pseudomonas vancouverensis]
MKTLLLRVVPAALVSLFLFGCNSKSPSTDITREILLRTSQSWDGTRYISYPDAAPELTVLKLVIPANTQLPWHSHPIPNVGYILSGELLVEDQNSGQTRRIKQGEAVAEMVNITHRGVTGDKPVELVVFYAGSKGIPLTE